MASSRPAGGSWGGPPAQDGSKTTRWTAANEFRAARRWAWSAAVGALVMTTKAPVRPRAPVFEAWSWQGGWRATRARCSRSVSCAARASNT